ncbi:hypothetical protein [Clostridium haemolyticum]|uniref:Uncharacterized protein n=1 Tax=Clostridium haemolyticum NCTC 9693 TaxID=1443114 RepID=A0ABR4THY1_CLOHA|nr:hypothetical protein [Clostridium haemolyticum]KEI18231.1 hypothetical protein Z960_03650 [Clostridium haemolyticum NCTC 9693]
MSINNLNQSIFRKAKKEDKFAQISNNLINNKNLSYKALGIATYILSKPNDWQVYISDLIRFGDKEKSVRSGINELIENKYMQRYRVYDMETGKVHHWETLVSEEPFEDHLIIASVKEKYLKDETGNIVTKKITVGKFTRQIPIVLEREEILLCQKGKLEESKETSAFELLSQKVQVEKLYIEKEGQQILINTNTKNITNTDNKSSSSTDEEEKIKYILCIAQKCNYKVKRTTIEKLLLVYDYMNIAKAIITASTVSTDIKNYDTYLLATLNNIDKQNTTNIIVEDKKENNVDSFNNYEQRSYDYNDLEKKLLGWYDNKK